MKGHHRFRQIIFLILFLIKVTWYEAHCFNHMWLDSPVVPSTTWLCDSPHHLSPRFLTFHLNWISVPMKHHLPFPLPSPSPASPGVNQCNSTKSFYFPFPPPPSVFLLVLSRGEHDAFYLLWQGQSMRTPPLRRTLVRQEGTRNLGGPRAHPLEAEHAGWHQRGWSQVAWVKSQLICLAAWRPWESYSPLWLLCRMDLIQ